MKTIFKCTIYFFLVILLLSPFEIQSGSPDDMLWGGYQANIQSTSGLGDTDPRDTAGLVVNIALGFLGVIFLLLIIYGVVVGAMAGSEEGAETAKKTLMAGTIGLVIVLASYGIAQFVINQLYSATGATG